MIPITEQILRLIGKPNPRDMILRGNQPPPPMAPVPAPAVALGPQSAPPPLRAVPPPAPTAPATPPPSGGPAPYTGVARGPSPYPKAPGTGGDVAAAPLDGGPATTGSVLPPPDPKTPQALQSPQDLNSLYTQLIEKSRKQALFQSGIGLIALAGAQPANKPYIAGMMREGGLGGSSGSFDPAEMFKLQAATQASERREQLRSTLPGLAEQYGITPEAAEIMFENDQLDEFIATAEKPVPDKVIEGERGEVLVWRDGKLETLREGEPKPMTIMSGGGGSIYGIDAATGASKEIIPPEADTGVHKLDDGTFIVDEKSGRKIAKLSGPEISTVVVTQPDGSKVLKNDKTGETIAEVAGPGGEPSRVYGDWLRVAEQAKAAGEDPPSFLDYQLSLKPKPATTTIISDKGETEGAKRAGEKFVDRIYTRQETAEANVQSAHAIQEAENAFEGGIISGSAVSTYEQEGRKIIADIFGLSDEEAANTDLFKARMNEIVLPRVKALGTGNSISNADVRFVEKAVGGDLSLDPAAVTRLLRIMERGEIVAAGKWNAELGKAKEYHPDFLLPDAVQIPQPSDFLLSSVPPAAIEALKASDLSAAERKAFNKEFGLGMDKIVLGEYW